MERQNNKTDLKAGILNIENEISDLQVIKLKEILNDERKDYVIIKMNNITVDNYPSSFDFGSLLHESDRDIIIQLNGSISNSAIIPLISNHHIKVIANKRTRFTIELFKNGEQYTELEHLDKFKKLFEEMLYNETLFSAIEIKFMRKHKVVFTAEDFIELGIVEDFMETDVKDNSDIERIRKLMGKAEIYRRRKIRDDTKCEGKMCIIPFGIN